MARPCSPPTAREVMAEMTRKRTKAPMSSAMTLDEVRRMAGEVQKQASLASGSGVTAQWGEVEDPDEEGADHGAEDLGGDVDGELVIVAGEDGGGDGDGGIEMGVDAAPGGGGEDAGEDGDAPGGGDGEPAGVFGLGAFEQDASDDAVAEQDDDHGSHEFTHEGGDERVVHVFEVPR